jgi:ferrochelatase
MSRRAALVMAYGTPGHADEIEAYYTDIRRGRPPTPEQLADLVRRYDAIGGLSPLAARTEAQRSAIAGALGDDWMVATGLRHAAPTIESAVATLGDGGADSIVGLVLAPHYSAMSVGAYHERAAAAAAARRLPYVPIDSWPDEPAYVDFLAAQVTDGLASLPPGSKVVFTAHSLPARITAAGDPYADQLESTAAAVAARVGLARWSQWTIAWQSAGRTPEPWLAPDLLAVIDELAASDGASGLLVCPCGFVSDHLEVLYDLDIEARRRAELGGLAFARTDVVNDDPVVMAALASRIVTAISNADTGWPDRSSRSSTPVGSVRGDE